jgi:hypothetical protein
MPHAPVRATSGTLSGNSVLALGPQELSVRSSPRTMPYSVRSKSHAMTIVASASNAIAMIAIESPGMAAGIRNEGIAAAASGKLTAHHDTLNGQHTTK